MARDQKSQAKPKPQSAGKSQGGVLVGIFIGLLLGALLAAGAALYFMRTAPVRQPEPNRPTVAPEPTAPPVALPGKPGDKPVEKPQFDFYKILPQGDSAVPEPSPDNVAAHLAPSGQHPAAPSDKLYLQVGAFEDPAEADNLKARLALMGIEASSQRVELPEKGAVHRVRVGPYASVEALNGVRAQLVQAGIPVAVVKNKP